VKHFLEPEFLQNVETYFRDLNAQDKPVWRVKRVGRSVIRHGYVDEDNPNPTLIVFQPFVLIPYSRINGKITKGKKRQTTCRVGWSMFEDSVLRVTGLSFVPDILYSDFNTEITPVKDSTKKFHLFQDKMKLSGLRDPELYEPWKKFMDEKGIDWLRKLEYNLLGFRVGERGEKRADEGDEEKYNQFEDEDDEGEFWDDDEFWNTMERKEEEEEQEQEM